MTRVYAIDANNDIFLDASGQIATVTGLAAVLQNCETAARTILDEMVFAANEGIPYFENVWVGVPNVAVFEAAMRQRLLGVQDVTEIVDLVTEQVGNVLTYQATIGTTYGVGTTNG